MNALTHLPLPGLVSGPLPRRRARVIAAFVLVALLCAGAALAFSFTSAAKPVAPVSARVAPALPAELAEVARQPTILVEADPDRAQALNAALPFSATPIEAARPFLLATQGMSDRERALHCLTQAVYYEAGFEPVEGRRAVAQVILNRLRHPAYPNTVCGVVYQGYTAPGCQFSFTCDGSLNRAPAAAAWAAAAAVARDALDGAVASSVGTATHYHANYVSPYWAPRLAKIVQIGAHIFYRWPGSWGRRGAFTDRYVGGEPGFRAAPAAENEAVLEAAVADETVPAQAPDERRAPNDVGGRLDVSKGWRLSIPSPAEASGSLTKTLTAQDKSATPTVLAAAMKPEGGRQE